MNTKTQSALRAALRQEDTALEKRLPEAAKPAARPETKPAPKPATQKAMDGKRAAPPATTVASPAATVAEPAPTAPVSQPAPTVLSPEQCVREAFKLAVGDCRRLKVLRSDLAEAGMQAGKSELVRAAISLLAAQDTAELRALLRALPPLSRTKNKKNSAGKDKPKTTTGKKMPAKKAASKDAPNTGKKKPKR